MNGLVEQFKLFGIGEFPSIAPYVRRERELLLDQADRSQGHYRSDIIVEWTEPMLGIHVEVKVGDPHLEKTWAEAQHLQLTYGGTWHHFLIVLPEQRLEAERMKKANEPPNGVEPSVRVITWKDVVTFTMMVDPRIALTIFICSERRKL